MKRSYKKEMEGLSIVQQKMYLKMVSRCEELKVAVPTALIRTMVLEQTQCRN